MTSLFEQWERHVDRSGDCWEWTASKDEKGYGYIGVPDDAGDFHTKKAHRITYEFFVGPIPEGMHVLHHCDNPSCVNPDHLYAGSNADNVRDREERGRSAKPPIVCGRRNGNAVLTESDVIRIRERALGGESERSIADQAGVGRSTVHHVIDGTSWGWLKEPSRWEERSAP